MTTPSSPTTGDGSGPHWLELDPRGERVAAGWRKTWVAVCGCGWESTAERFSVVAVDLGVEHSAAASSWADADDDQGDE